MASYDPHVPPDPIAWLALEELARIRLAAAGQAHDAMDQARCFGP